MHSGFDGMFIHFKIVMKDRRPTRRGILSIIGLIYDPLGFLAPLILPAKAMLRDPCRKGLDWGTEFLKKIWLDDKIGY